MPIADHPRYKHKLVTGLFFDDAASSSPSLARREHTSVARYCRRWCDRTGRSGARFRFAEHDRSRREAGGDIHTAAPGRAAHGADVSPRASDWVPHHRVPHGALASQARSARWSCDRQLGGARMGRSARREGGVSAGASAPAGCESSTDSYPSGHTTGVTAVALTTAYVLGRQGVISKRRAIALAAAAPAIMGVYRVLDDEHWTTDVFGGWLLGGAVALACNAILADSLGVERATAPAPNRPRVPRRVRPARSTSAG